MTQSSRQHLRRRYVREEVVVLHRYARGIDRTLLSSLVHSQ